MNKEVEKDRQYPAWDRGGEGCIARVEKVEFHPFPSVSSAPAKQERPPAFNNVRLELTAELGKTRFKIRDFVNLEEGSLLELNRPADENVLLLANGAPFARGEIVVINERFGVRIISFAHENKE